MYFFVLLILTCWNRMLIYLWYTLLPIQGGKEYLMRAHFGLPSVEGEDSEGKPPIQVRFEIPYFTTSGIQVRDSLSIDGYGNNVFAWI